MKNFDPQWNELGLYYIPSSGNYVSYFLKRSWGNYLFFPHPEVGNMYPFILGTGGIYKVFDCTLPFAFYNRELFNKFGAPTIGCVQEYHPDFLIEKYQEDYFDVDLTLKDKSFMLNLRGKTFLFTDLDAQETDPGAFILPRFIDEK